MGNTLKYKIIDEWSQEVNDDALDTITSVNKILIDRFKKIHNEGKMSQYGLAKLTGLARGHISDWVAGKDVDHKVTYIAKIAKVLGYKLMLVEREKN